MSEQIVREVFWGKTLPKIQIYKNGVMLGEWQFAKADNFRMELMCERAMDSEGEMDSGLIRQRIRGFRLHATFRVINVKNRNLLMFLRNMYDADEIIFLPHNGQMWNPLTNDYSFSMLLDSDFDPKYLDGRFIGHEIQWAFKGKDLLPTIPKDINYIKIIQATTQRQGGVTSADPNTSMTFWGEKMFWGDWEISEDDLRYVAFFEPIPEEEIDQYGKLW